MTNPATGTAIDPLGAFVSAHTMRHGSRPIPLISTRYSISIDGGFAVVESRRVFRNSEEASIEATLTFPLPVEAVLYALEAENDGRKLKAKARRREDARQIYEGAIEDGKAAVLHEELLRGIHMLSVAHIAPGLEIAVTTRWATTLTRVGERWQLRVPLTVGQVYGRSPLADPDALESGGADGTAEVVIHRSSGRVSIAGADLADGRARVPLNRPIDIEVTGASTRTLHGIGADGRAVSLQIAPLASGRDTLDLAILVDRSGSMAHACGGEAPSKSKHDAVIAGLRSFGPHLGNGDAAEVWEFDNEISRVGSTRDERPHWRVARHDWRPDGMFEQLVRELRGPGGGTEVGGALERVMRDTPARDLLLITDGKSYALDVQKLARFGRRVAVVLVGEDSLEANVGHLAAITGGSVFVATGNDITSAVAAAAVTLRSCPIDRGTIDGRPETIEAIRGGAVVKASWREAATVRTDEGIGAGVAAFATGLAMARMQEGAAAEFAEREGLCSHLTSLVLVDEAAHAQVGIPAMRKVLLPSPSGDLMPLFAAAACSHEEYLSLALDGRVSIDWDATPTQMVDGDLSSLDSDLAQRLREIASISEVQDWATRLKVAPIVLVVAVLAYSQREGNRTAERIARKVFGDTPPEWIDELYELVSLLV